MTRLLQSSGLFVFALAVRALSWRAVFDGPRVIFFGNDAYYHARRVLYAARSFLDVPRVDPYLNFPEGGEVIWSPLFDGGVALLLRLLGFDPAQDVGFAEAVLAWVPAVLGGLCVVATFHLTRSHFGDRAAWIAGLLLAILPAHAGYSEIGFLDHHAAVALAAVWLLAAAMALMSELPRTDAGRWPFARALWLGVVLAGSLLLWPGMLLHVALVEVGLAVLLLSRRQPERAARVGALFAAAHAMAFALLLPFCAGNDWQLWGSFSPVVLSDFQPWLCASIGLGFAVYATLCHFSARLGLARRVLWAMLALLGVLAAGAILLDPAGGGLGTGFDDAWRWFVKREEFQAGVAESRALFSGRHGFEVAFAERALSRWVYAAPLLLWIAGRSALRLAAPAPRLLFVGWGGGLMVATLVQARFFNSFSVVFCPLIGWSISSLLVRMEARWPADRLRRRLALGAGVAALFLLLQPALAGHRQKLHDQWSWAAGLPAQLDPLDQRKRLLLETAEWIRDNTPETSGFFDVASQPEYAVLSNWADGHVLEYVAQRPTVVDNFGDDLGAENFALAERYYLADEPEALRIIERLGVRYVVAEYRRTRARAELSPDAMISRLYFSDGEQSDRAVVARAGRIREIRHPNPALRRHRLVFESAPKPFASGERPGFKLYEVVAGALVEGEASPGTHVEARLQLETNQGRKIDFRSSTRADAAGHYALRLPYATQGAPPAIRPAPHWLLSNDAESFALPLSEADVQSGRSVPGPRFR